MVNEAQEPDDDVLSAREEFIAPGRIPFHHFQADSAILRYEPCLGLVGFLSFCLLFGFGGFVWLLGFRLLAGSFLFLLLA